MQLSFDSFVLAAATATLADEPAAREHADAVEFRMDLAADPAAQLDGYEGSLPVVATNRASWEGSESEADEDGRLASLERAARYDAVAAVDVELDALRVLSATRAATGWGDAVATWARRGGTRGPSPPSTGRR